MICYILIGGFYKIINKEMVIIMACGCGCGTKKGEKPAGGSKEGK